MTDSDRASAGAEGQQIQLPVMLRALRRRADLSQRDLARASGVPQATIARIESGKVGRPSFSAVEHLVRAAGGRLVVLPDEPGLPDEPDPIPHEALRDRGGRHYPAHLDITEVTMPEHWWGAWWTFSVIRERWPLDTVPAQTFDRVRRVRDEKRDRARRGALATIRGGQLAPEPGRVEGGRSWIWLAALSDGTTVGELRAHEFEPEVDGISWPPVIEVPPGLVMLDGVFVAPTWRGLGIGRRLIRQLRRTVAAPVAAISRDYRPRAFLEHVSFRPVPQLPVARWFLMPTGDRTGGAR